jgi:hypothetical protein
MIWLMKKRIVLTFSVAAVLLCGECMQVPETRESRLQVLATDLTGAPISDVEIELTPIGGVGTTTKTSTKESSVLYGDYQLRAYARGFAYARRELRIQQPEMLVRIELPVGSVGCPLPPAEIGGHVQRSDNTRELWVKATPVRGIGGGESRVSSAGYFLISGLEYSTYLVTVMDGENILHQKVVKTYPVGGTSSKLDIDLSRPR